jgi:hypothetical protein
MVRHCVAQSDRFQKTLGKKQIDWNPITWRLAWMSESHVNLGAVLSRRRPARC